MLKNGNGWRQRFVQTWQQNASWIGRDILIPLAFTRLALLFTGWFSQYFPANEKYPIRDAVERGWQFTPSRLLDLWGRWDTGWYMSIIYNGYSLPADFRTTQSNVAFFPLYPTLVRLLMQPFPNPWPRGAVLLVGVVVSNLFLLGALILLYRLIVSTSQDEGVARRTVLYMLLFPTSFFLSSFYTESTFLFFSVAAFYAASRQAWWAAGISGYFSALARPLGILILIPILWMVLEAHEWKITRIGWNITWLSLIPLGLLTYMTYIYTLTGNFLAPLQVQQGWNKSFALPWETIADPMGVQRYLTRVDQLLTVGLIVLSMVALLRFSSKSYGIYSFLLILPPLMSGTLLSTSRYYLVVFPVFILLAWLGKHRAVDQFVTLFSITLQILFMVAWSQFYWIA